MDKQVDGRFNAPGPTYGTIRQQTTNLITTKVNYVTPIEVSYSDARLLMLTGMC